MLNVTKEDLKNETDVFRKVKPLFSEFKDFYFIQNKDTATSEFDFNGYSRLIDGKVALSSLVCRVDVKVRDGIHHDQFPDYIVSKEKVEKSRAEDLRHYMVYFFPLDDALYIYCLNNCDIAFDPAYKYFHKRENRELVKEVYKVKSSSFLHRIIGEDIESRSPQKEEKSTTSSLNCYFDGCENKSTPDLQYWCCPDHKLQWQKSHYGNAGSKTNSAKMTMKEMQEAVIAMGKGATQESVSQYHDVVSVFGVDPASPQIALPVASLPASEPSPTT